MRKSDLKIHIELALNSLGIQPYAKTKNKTVAELKTMLAELRRQQTLRGIIKTETPTQREVIFQVTDHGSIVGFDPKTKDADELLHSIGASSHQWMGNVLYMDHREAESFVHQVTENGGRFVN